MDPIQSIKPYKDSSLAMLLAAQARGFELLYMEQGDLFMRDGVAYAHMQPLTVRDNNDDWFKLGETKKAPLHKLQVILMRKDPPVDMEFIYTTYLLEYAAARGTLVVNQPSSLRDVNEKLYTAWFPQCTPPTLVTRNAGLIREFLHEHQKIVLKPLDAMGGELVFCLHQDDLNASVIIETLTQHGQRQAMIQRFIPEISAGDKRILMIDGEPIPYALARIPAKGEARANLAAGGRGEGIELSERDRWICQQVGPVLREKGLLFVGLDVIGDYLTEINVTSPTCIRELDKLYDLDIAGQLIDCIQKITPQPNAPLTA
ncbi:MAG: glutathione synthase [Gammaproteobacteria bacterium]|nr:glutathione synthase [Gammaproteobacteria bacterium]